MKKAELINAVAEKTGMTKKDSKVAVDAVFASVADALASGDKYTQTGFGTFTVRDRAERQGRNPQTGEAITIAARKAVAFKAGKDLKDSVQ